jgi:hypothetical protein
VFPRKWDAAPAKNVRGGLKTRPYAITPDL